jgi:Protein of unknown function (DUF3618)
MTAEDPGTVTSSAPPPDDPEALEADIRRTREQLGQTVEALTAKVDVKARAQEKAAEVSGRIKGKVAVVKDQVTGRAEQVRSELADRAAGARQKIGSAGEPVASQVSSRAARAGATVRSVTPEPVQQTARKAADTVRQHRVAFAAAGATLFVGWLIMRRARR